MIRTQFDEALRTLHGDITALGLRVKDNLTKASVALQNADTELADEVRISDALVNKAQIDIDDEAAILIATQQPVARDMRELVAAFKISGEFERIGDHAVHLAKEAKRLAKDPWPRPIDELVCAAHITIRMLHDVLAAYREGDSEKAKAVAAMDDEVDRLHKNFIETALEVIRSEPQRASQAAKLIAASGFLERIGDHITNICESIVFVCTGEHSELN